MKLVSAATIGALVLSVVAATASHATNLNAQVQEKPTVKSELKRGMGAAEQCSSKYPVDTFALTGCVLGIQEKNAQTKPNHKYFDVGLFFQAWIDEDVLYKTDRSLAPSNGLASGSVAQAKKDTASMYAVFSDLAAKADISTDDLLSVGDLSDKGKAEIKRRLLFWASQSQ